MASSRNARVLFFISVFYCSQSSCQQSTVSAIWRASSWLRADLPSETMVKQTQLSLSDAAEWLGDWHPLAQQLGSTEGLASLCAISEVLCLKPVHDLSSLRRFLQH